MQNKSRTLLTAVFILLCCESSIRIAKVLFHEHAKKNQKWRRVQINEIATLVLHDKQKNLPYETLLPNNTNFDYGVNNKTQSDVVSLRSSNIDYSKYENNKRNNIGLHASEQTAFKQKQQLIRTSAKKSESLFIICMSKRNNFDNRNAIRQSWKFGLKNAAFFVGSSSCEIPEPVRTTPWSCTTKKKATADEEQKHKHLIERERKLIDEEYRKHKDMVMLPMKDFYRALPRKLKLSYEWCLENTNAWWFLKIDDDAGVRVSALESFLSTLDSEKMYVIGNIRKNNNVPRSGKWAEPHYKPGRYPRFANGAEGHVVSRNVAKRVHGHGGFEYQGEDVSLGIWISEMNLPVLWKDMQGKFVNNGDCHHTEYIVIGHNISPQKMKACFAVGQYKKKIYHTLIGRLGNQLFQMAAILGIASKHNALACLSGGELAKYFDGTSTQCSSAKRPSAVKTISENRRYATFNDFEISTDVEITGYLQSYLYFEKNLQSKLKFKDFVRKAALRITAGFKGKTLVGIHMRRYELDYLRIPPDQYFINAKAYFTDRFVDAQFIVTSDDSSWCKTKAFLLHDNVHIVESKLEPAIDMAILAACDHIILSSGTFGWWAAFLGPDAKDGTVVYYDSEFVMEHKVNRNNVKLSDFYPRTWVPMSSESENVKDQLDSIFVSKKKDWCPEKGSGAAKKIAQLYKQTALQKNKKCKKIERIGAVGDGGKNVCMDAIHKHDCVVYSLGSRLDFTFELDVIKKMNCKVFTFDCTVGNTYSSKIPTGVSFYPWCVGQHDSMQIISSDLGHTGETAQYYSIATIMKKLRHEHVDLLKMDIERHEFSVVKSLDDIYAPDQIVFETHIHNAYGVWGRAITQMEWNNFWAKIYSLNYLVFSYEPNPLCLCCCEFSMSRDFHRKVQDHSLLEMYQNTIVTAYFKLESKHSLDHYMDWMKNTLSLQDAMVVYTTLDMVETILKFRAHALNRTRVITTTLEQTLMSEQYSHDFWQWQLQIDPERVLHRDYRLYWVWNQKIEFIKRVVDDNPFQSSFFAWVDIGYFRNNMFNAQTMLKNIPADLKHDQILLLDTKSLVSHIKHFKTQDFVGAGFIGGYSAGIIKFHEIYYSLLRKHSDKFIGKEQPWMWQVCKNTPNICKLVVPDREHGDPWFYMAHYLTSISPKFRHNSKLESTFQVATEPDSASSAFRDSLFSSKIDPEADSNCNIIVSSFASTSLYDKAGPAKTAANNAQQKSCPVSTARYENGVLRIPHSEKNIKISNVTFDRGWKQLQGAGVDMGKYMPPQWRSIDGQETKVESEYVRLQYADGRQETFLQAQPKKQVTDRVQMTSSKRPHVLLLVVDNMSRQAATWTLPKTMSFLKNRHKNTFVYNRFGSTGHSTAPSMTPILTGKPYDMDKLDRERVRTRRYTPTGLQHSELLTSLAREHGYATAYVTDQEDAIFLGCNWWDRSWFDHVAPPPAEAGVSKTKCIGQFTNHQHGFQYIRSLWDTYEEKGHPVFAYYHASHGHATAENAHILDADILLLVKEALERNCAVALIGDHGPYAMYQSKLPLGTMSIPDALATEIGVGRIAELNQRRLVSQYDFYKTLRFLLTGSNSGGPDFSINLLIENVLPSRNCASAGIPDFRCFCSIWTDAENLPDVWKNAIETEINANAHNIAPQYCAKLSVANFSSVRRMVTCVGLSRFHFHRKCDINEAPHQHVQWMVDVQTSSQQTFIAHIDTSRIGLDKNGKEIQFENKETDADRDTYQRADSRRRVKIDKFKESLNKIELKQLTRYKKFEKCTPPEANAQFCVCSDEGPVSSSNVRAIDSKTYVAGRLIAPVVNAVANTPQKNELNSTNTKNRIPYRIYINGEPGTATRSNKLAKMYDLVLLTEIDKKVKPKNVFFAHFVAWNSNWWPVNHTNWNLHKHIWSSRRPIDVLYTSSNCDAVRETTVKAVRIAVENAGLRFEYNGKCSAGSTKKRYDQKSESAKNAKMMISMSRSQHTSIESLDEKLLKPMLYAAIPIYKGNGQRLAKMEGYPKTYLDYEQYGTDQIFADAVVQLAKDPLRMDEMQKSLIYHRWRDPNCASARAYVDTSIPTQFANRRNQVITVSKSGKKMDETHSIFRLVKCIFANFAEANLTFKVGTYGKSDIEIDQCCWS